MINKKKIYSNNININNNNISNNYNRRNLNAKRLALSTFIFALTIATLSGCGKKGNSVSENLVNENPSAIVVDEALLVSNEPDSIPEDSNGEFFDGNNGGSSLTPIDGSSIEVDPASLSEDSISENDAYSEDGNAEGNVEGTDSNAESTEEVTIYTNEKVIYNEPADKPLTLANLSGLNIDKLYVSFSVGNMQDIEVLGTETLKDGKSFSYTILDTASIKTGGKITLGVTAVAGKNTIDFGMIDIVDVSNMTVILTKNSDGYCLYLE